MFQVETKILDDGSCERTIWQPDGEMLPAEAAEARWRSRWGRVAPAAAPPAFADEAAGNRERKYFTAGGTFRSPAEIPEHFRNTVSLGPEQAIGRLDRSYERIDYAFVVEHRWRETLTNIVTRDGFLAARAELLDVALPILSGGIRNVYGTQYDVDGILRYVHEDGRKFLEQAAEVWFEQSAAHRPEEELAIRLAGLGRGFGLDLLDPSGKLVQDPERGTRLERFLRHRIVLGFRQKDGGRLSEPELRALLDVRSEAPFTKAWSRYWDQRRPEVEARLSRPFLRMVGLYNHPLGMTGDPKFAFSLRLPGEVVASNGSIHGGSEVRWRFRGNRSFPDGFTMESRSLEIDREAQRKILGRVAIGDVDQALALVREVEPSAKLRALFIETREGGTLGPLMRARFDGEDDRERLSRVRRLLGLTE